MTHYFVSSAYGEAKVTNKSPASVSLAGHVSQPSAHLHETNRRPDGGLTSMFPPTRANRGGRGLSLSFLSPLRFGLRALAERK